MPIEVHSTKRDPAKHHPVFDLAHWQAQFPLGDDRSEQGWSVYSPSDLAKAEQARRLARSKGDLGPSVPADILVWSDTGDSEKPWLTRIGGRPWREAKKKWPKDENGVPLVFLAQISFVDSADLLSFELPGDVVLIFGKYGSGWVFDFEDAVFEWSSRELKDPVDGTNIPWNAELPFTLHGVVHRTVQHTDWKAAEPAFEAVGYKKGGFWIRALQATSIGTYASLPQGWPFTDGDGNTLICTLSSFDFHGEWPLCDVPAAIQKVYADGQSDRARINGAMKFGIGDDGALWIYRDRKGKFHLDGACG